MKYKKALLSAYLISIATPHLWDHLGNPSLSAISNRYAARKAAFFISIKIVELAHNSLRSIKMARRAYLLLY